MNNKVLLLFVEVIHQKKIVRLKFRTKDNRILTRRCAPLDLALSQKANNKQYKYHFWNFDGLPKPHILSLDPKQIVAMEVSDEQFRPEEVVTWDHSQKQWTIERDWKLPL